MSRGKSSKTTTTNKSRVTFSNNSETKTTPGTNNTSTTETTPSNSLLDTAEDQRLSDTIYRVFGKKLPAILTGKDALLKKDRDCVLRKEEVRLKDISRYIHSNWSDMSVKHGCLCLDDNCSNGN